MSTIMSYYIIRASIHVYYIWCCYLLVYLHGQVVDMGCGECKLVRQLKSEHYIEQLYGVDIEQSILEESQYWIKPLITDFIHRRPHPLHACLMQGIDLKFLMQASNFVLLLLGSICNPDARIQGCDLLACIEV